MQKKIHFIINVLNEAERIHRVIESVQPFAASIIVIDAGSTDSTAELACAIEGVVVVTSAASPFDLPGRFGEALNLIDDKESDAWIFPITCSEVLTDSLGRELTRLINQNPKLVGVNMYRQSYTFGVPTHARRLFYLMSSFVSKNNVRLFRRHSWRMDLARIHSEYKVDPGQVDFVHWLLPKVDWSLLHYRDGSLSDFERKHTFYSDRECEERLARGEKGSMVKLIFSPILVLVYFLPSAMLSRRALVVAIYHAFYKFQVQAKMLLHNHLD